MKKFITLTLLAMGLCFSASAALTDQSEDTSQGTERNTAEPRNILEKVKQRVEHSKEVDQENRDAALERDLPSEPPSQQENDE